MSAAQKYISKQGDVLDAIVHAHYGSTSGFVERVLAANPGLADYGAVLPGGVLITLPDLGAMGDEPAVRNTINLWG